MANPAAGHGVGRPAARSARTAPPRRLNGTEHPLRRNALWCDRGRCGRGLIAQVGLRAAGPLLDPHVIAGEAPRTARSICGVSERAYTGPQQPATWNRWGRYTKRKRHPAIREQSFLSASSPGLASKEMGPAASCPVISSVVDGVLRLRDCNAAVRIPFMADGVAPPNQTTGTAGAYRQSSVATRRPSFPICGHYNWRIWPVLVRRDH